MPTPKEIIASVASLMNDTAQTAYTDIAVLPYMNMAMRELQEIFEQYNIPTTNATSAIINVLKVIQLLGFALNYQGIASISSDLVEIQNLGIRGRSE